MSVLGGFVLAWRVRRGPAALGLAVRLTIAALLAFIAGGTVVQGLVSRELTLSEVLPFHLCDMAMLLAIYALLARDQRAAELLWFWAGSGTLLAMITPDIYLGFPAAQFLVFFALHGLVLSAALVLVFGLSLRPRPGGPRRAFVLTCAYAAVVGLVNAAFGTNYMYLCGKPPNPTLLDAFGPWPVYLAASALVAFAAFALLGLPFRREVA